MPTEPSVRSEFDVFLSYSSRDAAIAEKVRDALIRERVSVWWDREGIQETDQIPDSLRAAVAATRVTLVLVSQNQATSAVCRWELLASLLDGEARGADRVLLLPLDDSLKNLSSAARSRRALLPDGDGTFHDAAVSVRSFLDALPPVRAVSERPPGPLHGLPGTAGSRFVGRADALLSVFDALLSPFRRLDAGMFHGPAVCVLSGMGGIGKTSLALFVAEQFGPGRSLGTLWLRASGDAIDNNVGQASDLDSVFRSLSDSALEWCQDRLGSRLTEDRLPVEPRARWRTLRDAIGHVVEVGESLLLVLDDVPSGVRLDDLVPRAGGISVLVTTRDALTSSAGYVTVPLEQFEEYEAMALLTSAVDSGAARRRAGEDPWDGEESVVRSLANRVGYHPLALDLLATRLTVGEPLAALVEETDGLTEEILDTPDFLAVLPTAHTPSIVATIASSVRGAARVPGADIRPLLRLLMVMPAGLPVPLVLADAVLGRGASRAVQLCATRSLVRLGGGSIQCHALTRGVLRRLWDAAVVPFDSDASTLEPELTRQVVDWLAKDMEGLRGGNDQLAADRARILLDVLDSGDAGRSQERIRRSEAFAAMARATYRVGIRSVDDLRTALRWTEDAKTAVTPPTDNWERMAWWAAEALGGLVLATMASSQVQPDLDPYSRVNSEAEALQVCNDADQARSELAARMLEGPEGAQNRVRIQDILLRSRFNMPGRHLHLAKAQAALAVPPYEQISENLEQMDRRHAEVIGLRRELRPDRLADIAAGIAGRGSAAYHRAVLLPRSRDERRADLEAATSFLLESLAIRRDQIDPTIEVDTAKSLELLAKTCWAAQCLDDAVERVRDLALACFEGAHREVDALRSPGPYVAGPITAADDADPLRSYRAECSRAIDRLAAAGDDRTSWAEAGEGCLRWLVLAFRHEMCKIEPDKVLRDFFGHGENAGESGLLGSASGQAHNQPASP